MDEREVEEVYRGELGQLFISEQAIKMIVYGALLEVEGEGLHPPDRVKGRGLLGPLSRVHQGDGVQILRVPAERPTSEPHPAEGGEAAKPSGSPGGSESKGEGEGEKRLKIKLSLVAEYGVPIHKAAERAIETVRRRVKELAGLDVEEIDVEITGLVRR